MTEECQLKSFFLTFHISENIDRSSLKEQHLKSFKRKKYVLFCISADSFIRNLTTYTQRAAFLTKKMRFKNNSHQWSILVMYV